MLTNQAMNNVRSIDGNDVVCRFATTEDLKAFAKKPKSAKSKKPAPIFPFESIHQGFLSFSLRTKYQNFTIMIFISLILNLLWPLRVLSSQMRLVSSNFLSTKEKSTTFTDLSILAQSLRSMFIRIITF